MVRAVVSNVETHGRLETCPKDNRLGALRQYLYSARGIELQWREVRRFPAARKRYVTLSY